MDLFKEDDEYEKELQDCLKIGLYYCADKSIKHIDFSFFNAKIFFLDEPDFAIWLNEMSHPDFVSIHNTILQEINEHNRFYVPAMSGQFVLVPIDPNGIIDHKTFKLLEVIFLLIFPSIFRLKAIIYFGKTWTANPIDGHYVTAGHQIRPIISRSLKDGNAQDSYLKIDVKKVDGLNSFIKKAFKTIPDLEYLKIPVTAYINAFYQQSLSMSYLNYCIALESLIGDDRSEITFQIARMCAVLNSENKAQGNITFKNVKQFYAERSILVHGGVNKKLQIYYPAMRSLTARVLVELINLNISEKTKIYELVNASGFGDKKYFVENYSSIEFLEFSTTEI